MLLDDRYPVLETLESRDGVTLYRVEGGWSSTLTSARPRTRTASTATGRRSGAWRARPPPGPGLGQAGAVLRLLSRAAPERAAPPKEVLAALAPFGFGPEHVAMGEDKVAYLAPWPLRLGAARRGRGVLVPGGPGAFPPGPGPPPLGPGALPLLQPPEYVVPDLVGKTAREAFLLLRDTGLGLEVEEGNDPSRPKEVVLEQDPHPAPASEPGGWCAWS